MPTPTTDRVQYEYQGRDRVFLKVPADPDSDSEATAIAFGSRDDVDPNTGEPAKDTIPFRGSFERDRWDRVMANPHNAAAVRGLVADRKLLVTPSDAVPASPVYPKAKGRGRAKASADKG